MPSKFPCLVSVSRRGEGNGVPVYRHLMERAEEVFLPFPEKGRYHLTLEYETGRDSLDVFVD